MEIIFRDSKLPVIKTKRLVLRDIRVEDISQAYLDWLNDAGTTKFLEIRFAPQTRKNVEAFVKSKLASTETSKHFGVYDQDGERLVGNVTFPSVNLHHKFADVSFVIGHPEARGRKYAAEALHGTVYYMFNHCGMEKIWAGYYGGHFASEKVLLKNGFAVEGRIKEKYINTEGERVDWVLVGLLKRDFRPNEDFLGDLPPKETSE